LFTDEVEGAGEVDLVVEGVSFGATAVPSGPSTETFGISGFGTGLVMAELPADAPCWCFRAPGGMYAFEPLTTAPYLSSSFKPLSSRSRFLSSTRWGLLTIVPRISLAIRCAFLSLSLKSAAFLSSFVVYTSSSNDVVTPNICSFTANWSHEILPVAVVPKVTSSTIPSWRVVAAGGDPGKATGCHACNSRSRASLPLLISVSVRKVSPLGTLASAGPDCQFSMLAEGMKRVSLRGVPGFEISFTSFRVRPVVSPSRPVDETRPS
jgi:hypothetical protein